MKQQPIVKVNHLAIILAVIFCLSVGMMIGLSLEQGRHSKEVDYLNSRINAHSESAKKNSQRWIDLCDRLGEGYCVCDPTELSFLMCLDANQGVVNE